MNILPVPVKIKFMGKLMAFKIVEILKKLYNMTNFLL